MVLVLEYPSRVQVRLGLELWLRIAKRVVFIGLGLGLGFG